jgi:hypothetical protein
MSFDENVMSIIRERKLENAPRVIVGRSHDGDVVVDDPTVSRRHLYLARLDSGLFFAIDLGSTSGSYIRRNGQWERIKSSAFGFAQEIKLGRVFLQVQDIWLPADIPDETEKKMPKPAAPLTETVAVLRRNTATGRVERVMVTRERKQ